MSMAFVDASENPRPQDEIEAALLWVKKRIVRPDFTDPEGVIHCVPIKDALQELLALRVVIAKTLAKRDEPGKNLKGEDYVPEKMCDACGVQVASQVINSNGAIHNVCSECANAISKINER